MSARPFTARDQAIADYLSEIIDRYGLQIQKLAERSGIPTQSFRRYIAGTRAMGASDFLGLLDALAVYDITPPQVLAEIRARNT